MCICDDGYKAPTDWLSAQIADYDKATALAARENACSKRLCNWSALARLAHSEGNRAGLARLYARGSVDRRVGAWAST